EQRRRIRPVVADRAHESRILSESKPFGDGIATDEARIYRQPSFAARTVTRCALGRVDRFASSDAAAPTWQSDAVGPDVDVARGDLGLRRSVTEPVVAPAGSGARAASGSGGTGNEQDEQHEHRRLDRSRSTPSEPATCAASAAAVTSNHRRTPGRSA